MGVNQYTKIFKFKSINDKKAVKKIAKKKLIESRYTTGFNIIDVK